MTAAKVSAISGLTIIDQNLYEFVERGGDTMQSSPFLLSIKKTYFQLFLSESVDENLRNDGSLVRFALSENMSHRGSFVYFQHVAMTARSFQVFLGFMLWLRTFAFLKKGFRVYQHKVVQNDHEVFWAWRMWYRMWFLYSVVDTDDHKNK